MVTLPRNCSLVALDSVGSTNDHAKGLAKSGYPAGTVVWAKQQTAGRGRHGNTWESRPGNLYMTLILRPDVNAALTGQLSFLAAVALARTLQPLAPEAKVGLKWPNDVLLDGKKAAGILLETELNGVRPVQWVVIGVGVNITDAPDGATHLNNAATAEQLLEKLVENIMALYTAWQKDDFGPVRAEWLTHAVGIGGEISVRLAKETFTGTFTGLDDSGALELKMPDGAKKIVTSGEVFLA